MGALRCRGRWARLLVPCLVLCLGLCLGLVAPAGADAAEYSIGPAPAWVEPIAAGPAPAAAALHSARGVAWLLHDRQTRLAGSATSTYVHSVSMAVDASGVEQLANISIGYDPSYQRLTLHAVNVLRGGAVLARLGHTPIHVLQRERELDYLIYDGSRTVSLLLHDVRPGDRIEYAYTVSGANPVLSGHATGWADLQWAVPVAHAQVRLLAPAGTALRTAVTPVARAPRERAVGAWHEYRWEATDTVPLKVSDDAPKWYDPYASVQWSDFPDWASVLAWALPLYPDADPLGPELRAVVARIAAAERTPAGRAAAVLKLVQHDVRYLGLEVGPGSYAPSTPDVVYARRFGDCKDKARLTVALLRALGVEAAPALANTERRRELRTVLPSATVFNHVLVRARVDGQVFWLDPTNDPQAGDLAHLTQPDYGLALVLAPGSTGLVDMRGPAHAATRIAARIDARAGFTAPARYTIETRASGAAADDLRDAIARQGVAGLQQTYLNYYARRYAGLRVAAPLRTRDDVVNNTVTTFETYDVAGFWERVDGERALRATMRAVELGGRLATPDDLHRNAPLAQSWPDEVTRVLDVLLPEPWPAHDEQVEVDNPAFRYRHRVEYLDRGRTVRLTDSYRAMADHVDAAAMTVYTADLKRAAAQLSYTLTRGDPVPHARDQRWPSLLWWVRWAVTSAFCLFAFLWWTGRAFQALARVEPVRYLRARRAVGGAVILGAAMFLCARLPLPQVPVAVVLRDGGLFAAGALVWIAGMRWRPRTPARAAPWQRGVDPTADGVIDSLPMLLPVVMIGCAVATALLLGAVA